MRETLARFELQPGESLLDVGCGTGVLLQALSASRPDARLAGADPSSEMLEVARKRLGDGLRVFDRAHVRTYGQRECRDLVQQAGFAGVRVDRYKINWLWGLMTAVGRKHAAHRGGPVDGASHRG